MAAKYPFTTTDLLRSILNLKCAIGTEVGNMNTDLKNGKDVTKRQIKLSDMRVVLISLERYNPFYYADTSINCLTIDQVGILMQKAKQYGESCNCNSPTRPVTIPSFYY